MYEYKRLKRIRRIRTWLDRIAYISLLFDIAIALITLVSVNVYASQLSTLLNYVDYGLTGIVIISIALFGVIFTLHYYEKILGTLNWRPRDRRGRNY
jgi:hypothetical protein